MSCRRVGLIGALLGGLVVGVGFAGPAAASGGIAAADLTFVAVGTGVTVAQAQAAAAADVQSQESGFVQRTGAACGGTLSSSQQEFQLSSGQSAVTLSVGVYCGAPAVSAFGLLFYGLGTSGTQSGAQSVAISAATANISSYEQATGAVCSPSVAAESVQTWQVSDGWVGLGAYPVDCQGSGSSTPPPPVPAVDCHVAYVPNSWAGGFTAQITISDTGASAIDGWTLTFAFGGDQHVTSAWNASVSQTGADVTAANLGYDGVIAAGGSVSFGLQGTWSADGSSPVGFAVNGSACS